MEEYTFDDFYGEVNKVLEDADKVMTSGTPDPDIVETVGDMIPEEPVVEYEIADDVDPVEMTEEVVD